MSLFEQELSRRALLGGLCLSGMIGLFGGWTGPAFGAAPKPVDYDLGLRAIADARHAHFGTAIGSRMLSHARYADAIIRDCNILVPENELKWRHIQPRPGVFDFSGYNKIAAFATQHNMQVRGHTLIWHTSMPDWTMDALETGTKRDVVELMTEHITNTLAHTSSVVTDWDIVNEAIDQNSSRADFLRENTLWMQALGPEYIHLAYKIAHEVNPHLTLTYNEYGIEYADGSAIRRRAGVLHLLRALLHSGIPIKQLGLQSHLACHRPLGGKVFTDFLRDVRALGVKIVVTELDIKLERTPGTNDERLATGAHYASEYLKMLQHDGPLDTVLCWGLSSPYSFMVRKDPNTLAPLPLDDDMQPLPLWYALRDSWLNKKT